MTQPSVSPVLRGRSRRLSFSLAGLAGLAAAALLAGCSTSSAAQVLVARSRPPAAGAKHRGNVVLLSAGSLDTLLTKTVGPAFHAATGYTLVDTSGGSSGLAADIKNKVYAADLFISAAPAVNAALEGPKNGGWLSWYADFASSPYVLGYSPKSKFAKDLQTMPWYKVVSLPGFRLGRTNPAQDPGGVLAVKALEETAAARHLPALRKLATESSDEYGETAEQAGVQNGQLDASFMYEADANSQHSPFVKLTGVDLAGDYTVTLLHRAPHLAAAEAFLRFLLGPTGRAELRADHFGVISPATVSGSGVPRALSGLLKS